MPRVERLERPQEPGDLVDIGGGWFKVLLLPGQTGTSVRKVGWLHGTGGRPEPSSGSPAGDLFRVYSDISSFVKRDSGRRRNGRNARRGPVRGPFSLTVPPPKVLVFTGCLFFRRVPLWAVYPGSFTLKPEAWFRPGRDQREERAGAMPTGCERDAFTKTA